MKKTTKIILIILMAIFSILAITINLASTEIEGNANELIKGAMEIYKSFPGLNISYLFIFTFIVNFYKKNYFKNTKVQKSIVILSIFFSLALIFGESFEKTNSWDLVLNGKIQVLKSVVKAIGYYFMIYIFINKLFEKTKELGKKKIINKSRILNFIFVEHPNISITLILILLWMPIIIIYYPAVIVPDAANQIKQLLGEYDKRHVKLINPNVTLNNHHPILSTLIIGGFIKIGKIISNIDLGLYLYTLFQLGTLIYVLRYSFKIMRKMNIPNIYQLFVLIFYVFCPIIFCFGLVTVKDIFFSSAVFYYVLLLIEVLVDENILKKNGYVVKLSVLFLLIMLFRNNGIYTILLSFPFIFIWIKKYRKKMIACLAIPILIYFVLNKIIYPAIGISPGSVKEALSIPFQQTARTMNEGKYYSDKDKEIINRILDVEIITNKYNPVLSDPVKDTFNKDYTKEMLIDYFKVWFKYLFKYPGTYLEATLNNSYGYLYPNKTDRVGYFKTIKWFEEENPLELKNLKLFQSERNRLNHGYKICMRMPLIGNVLSPGFYNWILLIFTVFTALCKDNKKFIVAYLPLLSIVIVCIASPYLAMRYMLSIVYCIPILTILSIYISRKAE